MKVTLIPTLIALLSVFLTVENTFTCMAMPRKGKGKGKGSLNVQSSSDDEHHSSAGGGEGASSGHGSFDERKADLLDQTTQAAISIKNKLKSLEKKMGKAESTEASPHIKQERTTAEIKAELQQALMERKVMAQELCVSEWIKFRLKYLPSHQDKYDEADEAEFWEGIMEVLDKCRGVNIDEAFERRDDTNWQELNNVLLDVEKHLKHLLLYGDGDNTRSECMKMLYLFRLSLAAVKCKNHWHYFIAKHPEPNYKEKAFWMEYNQVITKCTNYDQTIDSVDGGRVQFIREVFGCQEERKKLSDSLSQALENLHLFPDEQGLADPSNEEGIRMFMERTFLFLMNVRFASTTEQFTRLSQMVFYLDIPQNKLTWEQFKEKWNIAEFFPSVQENLALDIPFTNFVDMQDDINLFIKATIHWIATKFSRLTVGPLPEFIRRKIVKTLKYNQIKCHGYLENLKRYDMGFQTEGSKKETNVRRGKKKSPKGKSKAKCKKAKIKCEGEKEKIITALSTLLEKTTKVLNSFQSERMEVESEAEEAERQQRVEDRIGYHQLKGEPQLLLRRRSKEHEKFNADLGRMFNSRKESMSTNEQPEKNVQGVHSEKQATGGDADSLAVAVASHSPSKQSKEQEMQRQKEERKRTQAKEQEERKRKAEEEQAKEKEEKEKEERERKAAEQQANEEAEVNDLFENHVQKMEAERIGREERIQAEEAKRQQRVAERIGDYTLSTKAKQLLPINGKGKKKRNKRREEKRREFNAEKRREFNAELERTFNSRKKERAATDEQPETNVQDVHNEKQATGGGADSEPQETVKQKQSSGKSPSKHGGVHSQPLNPQSKPFIPGKKPQPETKKEPQEKQSSGEAWEQYQHVEGKKPKGTAAGVPGFHLVYSRKTEDDPTSITPKILTFLQNDRRPQQIPQVSQNAQSHEMRQELKEQRQKITNANMFMKTNQDKPGTVFELHNLRTGESLTEIFDACLSYSLEQMQQNDEKLRVITFIPGTRKQDANRGPVRQSLITFLEERGIKYAEPENPDNPGIVTCTLRQ